MTEANTVSRVIDDTAPVFTRTGNVDETEGILIIETVQSLSSTEVANNQTLVSLHESVGNNLLRIRTSAGRELVTHDGVNVNETAFPFVKGTRYRIAVRWSAEKGTYQAGYKDITNSGAWVWGTNTTFNGSYETLGDFIQMAVNAWVRPNKIRKMDIYDTDQGTTWIESNYP